MAKHLKEVKLRAHVVLKLLFALLDRGHPAFARRGRVEHIRAQLRKNMESMYPEPVSDKHLPEERREGTIPPSVLEEIERAFVAKTTKSVIYEKNATPAEGARPLETLFDDAKPQAILEERYSDIGQDANESRAHAFAACSTLHVKTGKEFVSQWRPQYISEALPFTFPWSVGGCEFKESEPWRRDPNNAAPVSITDFRRGMVRRVEAQFRSDWTLAPLLNNLWFRYTALYAPRLAMQHGALPGRIQDLATNTLLEAAADLYKRLEQSTYTTAQGDVRPLDGDTFKLLHAQGITPLQKKCYIICTSLANPFLARKRSDGKWVIACLERTLFMVCRSISPYLQTKDILHWFCDSAVSGNATRYSLRWMTKSRVCNMSMQEWIGRVYLQRRTQTWMVSLWIYRPTTFA